MTRSDWFGQDEGWERPAPTVGRKDLATGAGVLLVMAVGLELMRSYADFQGARPVWTEYLAMVLLAGLLVWRRRRPLLVCSLACAVMFCTATWVPEVGYQAMFQYAFYFAVYSGVAWGGDRRATGLLLGAITLLLLVWLAWDFALGQAIAQFHRSTRDHDANGLLPPLPAWIALTTLFNLLYLAAAVLIGQSAWREALTRARLGEQAATISAQAAALRDQAVVDERLRIARELHDVVAHHVSVMGIQAAGARRQLEREPGRAAVALGHIEESSRAAVAQMRSLLGALRGTGEPEDDRGPQPGLADLPRLVDDFRAHGLQVDCDVLEPRAGALDALPAPVQLSLFRTVEEALSNVVKHSTARRASVVLRRAPGQVEVEVLDDGRPRGATGGSGLGLLGMRERIASHGGSSEIGPRVTGGYRVRVRFPVDEQVSA